LAILAIERTVEGFHTNYWNLFFSFLLLFGKFLRLFLLEACCLM
jgi:hypothetical protein